MRVLCGLRLHECVSRVLYVCVCVCVCTRVFVCMFLHAHQCMLWRVSMVLVTRPRCVGRMLVVRMVVDVAF